MTMKLIETKTLAATTSLIQFTAIPQTFTDLFILTSLRNTTTNAGWATAEIRPNGNTTNISARVLYGFGSTVGSITDTAVYHQLTEGGITANTFSNSSVYIPNYSGATAKSISVDTSTEGNQTNTLNAISANLWNSTAAITSLDFVPIAAGIFAIGSTISLYGITKGTDGIVVVS